MKFIKLILFAVLLVFAVFLGLSIIGFVYSALWYLFWIGVLAVGGYAGYKLLKKSGQRELEGRDEISQIELDNAKIVRELDEYKQKLSGR